MARPGIAASTAVVAGLTAGSAVLGFARDAVVAAALDACLAARA